LAFYACLLPSSFPAFSRFPRVCLELSLPTFLSLLHYPPLRSPLPRTTLPGRPLSPPPPRFTIDCRILFI
jgi:hypothetical protein